MVQAQASSPGRQQNPFLIWSQIIHDNTFAATKAPPSPQHRPPTPHPYPTLVTLLLAASLATALSPNS